MMKRINVKIIIHIYALFPLLLSPFRSHTNAAPGKYKYKPFEEKEN
jgi:hypothetical protein